VSSVEAAVERVWPGRSLRLEELSGGITNHNVKVSFDGEGPYVLRIAGRDTVVLGIDRQVEHEATLAAAELGVGPEVIRFVEPEGWLVTRFIEGSPIPLERMRDPETLARVAETLRTVHSGPPVSGSFDSFGVVEDYFAIARSRGAEDPPDYAWAHALARRIERQRSTQALRLCHNDLLNANFIDDGERIRIVDWEYAGLGDPFFDLANFAINHELDPESRQALLEAYFGELRDDDEMALELMRFMSDFREAMWGVLQNVVSSLDFDFATYATDHFARLRRTADEPEFRAALEA
jgi:thiamine kinase-like enzyme